MKKTMLIVAVIAVLVGAIALTGCRRVLISGEPGPLSSQVYSFTGFTKVDVSSAFKVEIIPSDNFSVKITASEDVIEHVRVVQAGDTLRISTDALFMPFGSRTLAAEILMPELLGLELSGATEGTARGFKTGKDFKAEVSGASTLNADMETGGFDMELSGASEVTAKLKTGRAGIVQSGASKLNIDLETGEFMGELSGASDGTGTVKATKTTIDITGASHLKLTGAAGDLMLTGSGASDADLRGMAASNADINLSGASSVNIDVNGSLNVTLSGASKLDYGGNPTLGNKIEISGGSSLDKR